jgi:hypothetical protein
MGLLGTQGQFQSLPDGRTIFLPRGPDGPAYLVPDEATRGRIEKWLRVSGIVVSVLAVVLFRLFYVRGTIHWSVLLTIPIILYVRWLVRTQLTEQLPEFHDESRFLTPVEPPPPERGGLFRRGRTRRSSDGRTLE